MSELSLAEQEMVRFRIEELVKIYTGATSDYKSQIDAIKVIAASLPAVARTISKVLPDSKPSAKPTNNLKWYGQEQSDTAKQLTVDIPNYPNLSAGIKQFLQCLDDKMQSQAEESPRPTGPS